MYILYSINTYTFILYYIEYINTTIVLIDKQIITCTINLYTTTNIDIDIDFLITNNGRLL